MGLINARSAQYWTVIALPIMCETLAMNSRAGAWYYAFS